MKLIVPIAIIINALLTLQCQAGKRYALVVGVSEYGSSQPLPPLPYSENDVDGLSAILKAGGYEVTLMSQAAGRVPGQEFLTPSADNIRHQMSQIFGNPRLNEDDLVIVAFAGHAVQFEFKDDSGRKSTKLYVCPVDADVSGLPNANSIRDRNRLIDLDELYRLLGQCRAGGKLLMMDVCRENFKHPAMTRASASVKLPALPSPTVGTAAMFSSSASERACDDSDLKHGVFFYHVIKALGGAADSASATHPADGQVTLAELSEYVSSNTYDYVRKKYSGAKQKPELKGEFQTSIPLMSIKDLPAVLPSRPTVGRIAKQKDKEATNSLGMKLILIKAGTFKMGSPEAETNHKLSSEVSHQVTLTKDYYLGSTEVTQEQWQAVMGTTPWKDQKEVKEGPNYAASYVSLYDAEDFCKRLSAMEKELYQLPSEAQWEYACRGGTTTSYSFGNDISVLGDYAWFGGITRGVGNIDNERYAHEVGQKLPNPFGLYDMHGNVWEWCADRFRHFRKDSVTDPTGPNAGGNRVCRGGSWYHFGANCRSSYRFDLPPESQFSYLGFRVLVQCEN